MSTPSTATPNTSTTSPPRSPRALLSPAVLLLFPVRLFLAAGWLRAAAEKAIEHQWWNGQALRNFLADHHDSALPFFRPVAEHVIGPQAVLVSALVLAIEVYCGVVLLIGRPMRSAIHLGILLNVVFIVAGQVNPSAFYLVMELALLFGVADGIIGMKPSRPSRLTLALGVVVTMAGCSMIPYIRSFQPAGLVADPAAMLAFIGVIGGATLALRWLLVTDLALRWSTNSAVEAVINWVRAQPEPEPTLAEVRPALSQPRIADPDAAAIVAVAMSAAEGRAAAAGPEADVLAVRVAVMERALRNRPIAYQDIVGDAHFEEFGDLSTDLPVPDVVPATVAPAAVALATVDAEPDDQDVATLVTELVSGMVADLVGSSEPEANYAAVAGE